MQARCPTCVTEIALEDVNVATDLALCRRCKQTFAFSELSGEAGEPQVDLRRPPKGAWFEQTSRGFEVGASTRSPQAFFLVPFMMVWSGGSLGGIYGTQIAKGEFNPFISLFGIPFVLGTLVLGSFALMTVAGKVRVRVEGDEGQLFTGVGPFGWTRRFSWREMTKVGTTQKQGRNGSSEQITLEGQRRIDFGSGLNTDRLHFVLAALRKMRREKR
jgi:hypothetical protein